MLDGLRATIASVGSGIACDRDRMLTMARAELTAVEQLIEAANAECDSRTIRTVAALVALKRLQGRQPPEGK